MNRYTSVHGSSDSEPDCHQFSNKVSRNDIMRKATSLPPLKFNNVDIAKVGTV